MADDALREKVAPAMAGLVDGLDTNWRDWIPEASAAVAAILPPGHVVVLESEVSREWLDCAMVDATMEGPKLKGWNRSALDRLWSRAMLAAAKEGK